MVDLQKLQENEKNFMNLEIQQKQIMMMGGILEKDKENKKQLTIQEIEQFKKDWRRMYFGFTSINWGQGMTLGMAWQKALEQMDGFAMSKLKMANHPANDTLLKYHREFRRDMAKTIMTNPYVEEKLPDRYKNTFLEHGQKEVVKHKSKIDDLYKQYMPQQDIKLQQTTAVKFDLANRNVQQMLQQIMIQQQIKQRAA